MKTNRFLLLSCLLITACLDTQLATPAPTATPQTEPTEIESGAVFKVIDTPQPAPVRECATVIAIVALHLRSEPNSDSRVINWLHAQEIVTVHRSLPAGWTSVTTTNQQQGYVKSEYIESAPCH